MYQNPTLFPAISNRETWLQVLQLADDDTGDLISLTDDNDDPLYGLTLEITPARVNGHMGGYGAGPYYDDPCEPLISATLDDYILILGVGTVQIQIPKSVISGLRAQTYDVFLTITPNGQDDARQLFCGRLPVVYGGRST